MARFVFLLTLGLSSLLSLVGCGPITFTIGGDPGERQIQASTVEADDQWLGPRVAIIDVSGMLMNAERRKLLGAGENPVSLLHEKLQRAKGDERVKAVILRLNTPGGAVTASDIMYRSVQRFKRQTDKPVIALMMDVTASGGYYLACASDEIVTYPTTVTGSIGVIMHAVSIKPALSWIGVEAEAITSGKNKAAGSLLTTLTEEQRQIFQSMVDDFYARFERVVRQARPEVKDAYFNEVTDGRVVSGRRAVTLGLADRAGDLYTAFDRAKSHAGIQSADLVVYHRNSQYVGSPYARRSGGASSETTQINLAQLNVSGGLPGTMPVGFYYLWQPGWQQRAVGDVANGE